MAGKMWCCGGSSGSGGGSGGLAAVATEDTPTVTLTGDGTAGSPLQAEVKVEPFEPNGLEISGLGLRVRPSDDAGNAIGIGSDGRLFVPESSGGTPTVVQGDGMTATVTGSGTAGDPYVVHSIAGGTPTVVQAGTNVTVTGSGTAVDPYIVSAAAAPLTVEDSSTVDLTITPSGALRADVIPGSVTIPTVYATTPQYRLSSPPPTYSGVTIPEDGVWAVQIDTYWSATHTSGGVYSYTNDLRIGHIRGGALIAQYNDVWGPTVANAPKNAGEVERGTTSQSYVGTFLAGDQIALYDVDSNPTDATFTFTPRVTMFKVSD
ncbi:hypothetical protein ABTX34_29000 [Streptomyces sp. NPDC096538]|uniref:hypothetical protein n=1 Tax=Streptomyces sp. NPDC096538 TaxID=3155427 RepID=UPI003331828B